MVMGVVVVLRGKLGGVRIWAREQWTLLFVFPCAYMAVSGGSDAVEGRVAGVGAGVVVACRWLQMLDVVLMMEKFVNVLLLRFTTEGLYWFYLFILFVFIFAMGVN